jgi:hypothetical protein
MLRTSSRLALRCTFFMFVVLLGIFLKLHWVTFGMKRPAKYSLCVDNKLFIRNDMKYKEENRNGM